MALAQRKEVRKVQLEQHAAQRSMAPRQGGAPGGPMAPMGFGGPMSFYAAGPGGMAPGRGPAGPGGFFPGNYSLAAVQACHGRVGCS